MLSWDPVLTGYLSVIVSVLVLCGSVYLLLATNLGARLGFLVAWTGLWGWMLLMGITWWVFAIGWKGTGPTWDVLAVTTNPATVTVESVQQLEGVQPDDSLPAGWIEIIDPDARSVADSHIVCSGADPRLLEAVNPCLFDSVTDFHTHRVVATGGERYRPLGIPDNVITQYFVPSRSDPRYAVVQLQPFTPTPDVDPNLVDADGGVILPTPQINPDAPVYSVVMVRDEGNERLRPALLTIFSALLFGLGCYHLHRRDQAVWAVRAAASD